MAVDKGCQTFIGAGSQAEYGKTVGSVGEDYPALPNTEYGKYKLKAYLDISRMGEEKGVAVKWPRIFSAYGKYDFSGTLIMSAIEKFRNNESLDMTEGIQNWNYLYVRDIAELLRLLGTTQCEDGVYNFASEDNRPLREYLLELKEIMKSSSSVNFGAVPYGREGVVSFRPVINKLKRNIPNFKFSSFAHGSKEIIANYGIMC